MSSRSLRRISQVLLLFGVACYLTSCAMNWEGDVDIEEQLPANGGTLGPIEVKEAGTVLEVHVEQRIQQGAGRSFKRWSFVTSELLGADKQYLTGFGGGFWHEAGYDEGYWREQDASYQNKITVPEAGRYYLRFKTESDVTPSELSDIQVSVESNVGSSLPHHVAALLAFVVGGGLWISSVQKE
jgi:hypothetical protein